jgi:cytoskeletal protein RodZ
LARRTPLVAALAVLALGGGAVVVAQAEVTDRAAQDASAPADVASAPVAVVGNPLPAAKKPTSSPPKLPAATLPAATTPAVTIPSLTTGSGTQTNGNGNTPSKDGENLPEDGKADPNDLTAEKKLKVKRTDNYDPALRLGVEFVPTPPICRTTLTTKPGRRLRSSRASPTTSSSRCPTSQSGHATCCCGSLRRSPKTTRASRSAT